MTARGGGAELWPAPPRPSRGQSALAAVAAVLLPVGLAGLFAALHPQVRAFVALPPWPFALAVAVAVVLLVVDVVREGFWWHPPARTVRFELVCALLDAGLLPHDPADRLDVLRVASVRADRRTRSVVVRFALTRCRADIAALRKVFGDGEAFRRAQFVELDSWRDRRGRRCGWELRIYYVTREEVAERVSDDDVA